MQLNAFSKGTRSDLVALRKTLRIMKAVIVMILVFCLQASAKTFSQEITLSLNNASFETAIREIQKQTDYKFVYTKAQMEMANKVSLEVRKEKLETVLQLCFKDQPLTYVIEENVIAISVKEKSSINQDQSLPLIVKGRIVNENGEGVIATITIKGTNTSISTDADGYFELKDVDKDATLIVTSVNIESYEIKVKGRNDLGVIEVKTKIIEGENVQVTTGYQQLPKERATGSFDIVNNQLINRRVSTNILDRIENLTPGVLFNHGDAINTDALLIRGRSTIFANAQPLIVLDNFPYDGNINNINPNDVESITILKDAAAASIWGARAGNGVVVITTKRGKTSKPHVEVNTNITFQKRPDIFNINSISSTDYIELEKYLFTKGYYNSAVNDPFHAPLTPVVELLFAKQNGTIPAIQADAQIEALKKYDVRNDVSKYLFRNAVYQQHAVNVGGNTPYVNYYISAGYDRNIGSQNNKAGSQYDRITLRTQNSFKITNNLQFDIGVNYIQSNISSGNNPGSSLLTTTAGHNFYPYAQLVDATGNPLAINLSYRESFLLQSEQKGLLSWRYKPVEEVRAEENKTKSRDFLINTGIKYKITASLNAEIKYQYQNQLVSNDDLFNESSFFTRNLINTYTQIDPNTGALSFPIPKGGIMNITNSEIAAHQGRAQINYNQSFSSKHRIAAIGGYEIRGVVTTGSFYRIYGYKPEIYTTNNQIDYTKYWQLSTSPFSTGQIETFQGISKRTDHFLSYYTNVAYTYNNCYTISASGRKDEANLFGVKTNQKGAPLWSVGGSWLLSNNNFYKISWLPFLKLRATYGVNGNISRLTSAYTTAIYRNSSTTSASTAIIQNPPNESLRWEKVQIMNLGLDFETKNKILSGSIEYYKKKSKDLMGQAPVDPTLGQYNGSGNFFYGNVAGMEGNGIDLQLNSRNLDGKIKWYTSLIFSHTTSKVSKYLMPVSSSGNTYLPIGSSFINPVIGKPLFAIYSFKWQGLSNTGDPVGYFKGQSSTDYAAIYSQTKLDSMVYNGPVQPTTFGSLRNIFIWQNLSLSFNISYKLGYYYRKPSVNYIYLFGTWNGSGDYAKRWQKPGDENITNIPSLIYPANVNRENFYQYSEILVQKGDHIRLEDINISYDLDKASWKYLPFRHVRIYVYASNLGIIWTANKNDVDPYYNNTPTTGRSIAFGVNVSF